MVDDLPKNQEHQLSITFNHFRISQCLSPPKRSVSHEISIKESPESDLALSDASSVRLCALTSWAPRQSEKQLHSNRKTRFYPWILPGKSNKTFYFSHLVLFNFSVLRRNLEPIAPLLELQLSRPNTVVTASKHQLPTGPD